MTESTASLAQRIQMEFDARAQQKQATEQQRLKAEEDRKKGLEKFGQVCDELRSVWRPRLEEFAKQFGDKIKVTPTVSPSQREAKIVFLTNMATMTLTLSVTPSPDLSRLILEYDLLIIPIFFNYERHAKLEMPLDKVDKATLGKWIDDQLISCVKAYFSMQENEIYAQRAMVEDPVTKVKLLPEDAKGTLQHEGRTLYFSSEDSLRKFKEKLQVEKPAAAGAVAPAAAKPAGTPAKPTVPPKSAS